MKRLIMNALGARTLIQLTTLVKPVEQKKGSGAYQLTLRK